MGAAAANLAALGDGEAGAVSVLKYPLIIAALLIFIRSRAAGRDLRDTTDALVPAVKPRLARLVPPSHARRAAPAADLDG